MLALTPALIGAFIFLMLVIAIGIWWIKREPEIHKEEEEE